MFLNLSVEQISCIFNSAFLLHRIVRVRLLSHCINNNEQQMFSVLGYWQLINWQIIGDPQNSEKFKKNDIEGFFLLV